MFSAFRSLCASFGLPTWSRISGIGIGVVASREGGGTFEVLGEGKSIAVVNGGVMEIILVGNSRGEGERGHVCLRSDWSKGGDDTFYYKM